MKLELAYVQKKADRRLQCIKRLIDVYIYHDQKEVTEVIAAWEEARKILVEAEAGNLAYFNTNRHNRRKWK